MCPRIIPASPNWHLAACTSNGHTFSSLPILSVFRSNLTKSRGCRKADDRAEGCVAIMQPGFGRG